MVKTTERHGEAPLKDGPFSGYDLKKALIQFGLQLYYPILMVKMILRKDLGSERKMSQPRT